MRIANIIIAHKNPLQLERLIKKMNHPNFDFYIHLDKKVDINEFEYLSSLNNVRFIHNRIKCNWGGYSTLLAMVGSLNEVVEYQVKYGFYNLLSAQDYPIKSNNYIYNYFLSNLNKSFIFFNEENPEIWWQGAKNRFQRYHLTDFNFRGKFFVEKFLNIIMPKRQFPLKGVLYGGSKASWWSLNEECAKYLSEYFRTKINFGRFLKFCWGTDEFVIPTILLNSCHRENIINDNLRYIEFPKGKANPKILDLSDLENLLDSNMLFARKFDLCQSADLLNEIDRKT